MFSRRLFDPDGPTLHELTRQALCSTRRGYDLLAPRFDVTPFRTPTRILDKIPAVILEKGPIDTALDLCCGTGAALEMVGPLCRRLAVGIDFSRGMLEVCAGKQALRGSPVTHLVEGDVLAMPFVDRFDIAVCFGALGHIPDRIQDHFLEEVASVLRPGGRFIFPSACMPSILSTRYWLSRSFNGIMHLRNALFRESFVMYYLRFLLPDVSGRLERAGFTVEVRDDLFDPPHEKLKLVVATRS